MEGLVSNPSELSKEESTKSEFIELRLWFSRGFLVTLTQVGGSLGIMSWPYPDHLMGYLITQHVMWPGQVEHRLVSLGSCVQARR